MSRSDDLRLLDILDASDRITRLVAPGRSTFDDDESLQPAIERMLEIIGESANSVSEEARMRSRASSGRTSGACPDLVPD